MAATGHFGANQIVVSPGSVSLSDVGSNGPTGSLDASAIVPSGKGSGWSDKLATFISPESGCTVTT